MEQFKVGTQVIKKSGKPFRSGLKKGTIAELTVNPQSPKQGPAARIAEDNSIVDLDMLRLVF